MNSRLKFRGHSKIPRWLINSGMAKDNDEDCHPRLLVPPDGQRATPHGLVNRSQDGFGAGGGSRTPYQSVVAAGALKVSRSGLIRTGRAPLMAARWRRNGRIDANQIGVAARRTGLPGGIRIHERQAPIRQAIARARVREFGPGSASSGLDASLRFAAQEDHEIRAFAGLRAQRLVRDDQGRSRRRHRGDTIQWLLRVLPRFKEVLL
jgi:hypothetical protein